MDRRELKVHVLRAKSTSKDDYTRFGSFYLRLSDKLELTDYYYDYPAKRAQVQHQESNEKQDFDNKSDKTSGKMANLVKL